MVNRVVPHPILKWAGGKTQVLQELSDNSPLEFKTYYEPFLGGGAFFFHLYRKGLVKNAVVADLNKELIALYRIVRDDVDDLISELASGKYTNDRRTFYNIRTEFNRVKLDDEGSVEQAARLLFLNRTCFNGLYRVNSRGEFNVPFGRYKNPKLLDETNLRAVNKAFKLAKILHSDFQETARDAAEGDFVYLDPPYAPLTATAEFTAYTKAGFSLGEQKRLARLFKELDSRGCYVLESNSATSAIHQLYAGYRIVEVYAARAISSDGSTRGKIPELLVSNYAPSAIQTKLVE
jgi:DNA adenine methylase